MKWKIGIQTRAAAGIAALCLMGMGGCSSGGSASCQELTQEVAAKGVATEEPGDAFYQGSADFGVKLFQKAYQASGHSNTMVAPLTLQTVLAMTANGAKGDTLEQMESVLGGVPIDQINRMLGRYLEHPNIGKSDELTLANSVWINENLNREVNSDFLLANKSYYQAQVYRAPFDSQTVRDINRWVSDHTDERISELLEDPISSAAMILVNATLFHAQWEKPYKTSFVRTQTFTAYDGSRQNVEMMSSTESLYVMDEQAVGFLKPYADRRYSFMALLPNEDVSLDDFVSALNGKRLRDAFQNARSADVDAHLPKFTFEDELDAKEALAGMGMSDAFNADRADFSGIVPRGASGSLYISKVSCKTFIQVDETGTEAAAAADVEIRVGGISPHAEVTLDRPFLFAIMDNRSGYPLFLGAVTSIAE